MQKIVICNAERSPGTLKRKEKCDRISQSLEVTPYKATEKP
jgi:hypothetical protein